MLTKFIPAALLVLAALVTTARGPWPPPVTAPSASQHQAATPARPIAPPTAPAGIHAPSPVAVDDYRMNLQAGVTANAYGLPPLAEHDAARTQSMIDGFSSRRSAHGAPATNPTDHNGLAPSAGATSSWLTGLMAGLIAGLMAVLWMALRRRG